MEPPFDPLEDQQRVASMGIGGVIIGVLVGLVDDHSALVTYPGSPCSEAVRAKTVATLRAGDVGRQVALLFECGDPSSPIVVGCIQSALIASMRREPDQQVEAVLDGERVVLSASRELVLRCGKASITLTQAGKVLVNGTYLSSSSSGLHRIKGGSVQIN